MNFLKDADFKHYFKMFVIGIVVFGILSFLFLYIFKDDYGIVLNKDTIEYGKNVRIVDLVESVAGNPINDSNKISSNTVSVNGYEVTFDEIDTFKLGSQNITAKYTDSSIQKQSLSVNIVDNKKPIIKIKKDIDTKMDLKDVRRLKVDSFYSVSDNETPDKKIKIKKYIKEEKYSYGDTVHLVIEATDKSGNVSKKKIKININEKKVEKDESKPEDSEDKDKKDEISSEHQAQESSTQSSQSVQQSVQQAPQQSQITPAPSQSSRPKPSNKQYLFSQGYDMSSAPSACQNDLLSSGHSGSCTPIQDSDGIYLGMQLIFN